MKKPSELSYYEMLSYSTTRIECTLQGGGISTGTGFFIFLNDNENKEEDYRVALITNKHVVKDAIEGRLTLTTRKDGVIQDTTHFNFPHSHFEEAWIPHPDETVDLCMLNFKPYENVFYGLEKDLFYLPIPIKMVPDKTIVETFDTLEEVIMIGYPNGIWDSYNNKPIFRKGITATDYRMNYENKSEFLIDMAVFGGSSGSPVLTVKKFRNENDEVFTKTLLIGILYAGFQHRANGEVKVVEIPQTHKAIVEMNVPNNLGIVIKAEKLYDFRNMFYE